MWLYDGGPAGAGWVTALASLLFISLLSLRRVAPSLTIGLASFVMLTQTMLGGRMTTTLSLAIAAVLLVASTGLHLPRVAATAWAFVYLAVAWIDVAVATEQGVISDLVFTAVLVVGLPVVAGATLRAHRERSAELAHLNARLADQADRLASVAALEERARIAREMHDVVSHSVSLMVVQAGAARRMLDKDPDQSRQALLAVEEVGREALTELRRTLGVLRDDAAPSVLTPQPGTEQIPEIVERAGAAGLDVVYAVQGEPRAIAPGAALALYRVAQEALTNAARHAAGARIRLTLSWEPDAVQVSIVDDGGQAVPAAAGSGLGLVGMRERVTAYGGTLRTGPVAGATGFEVRARLPVPDAVEGQP